MDPTTHMLMLTSMHAKLTNMQYPVLVLGARVVAGEPGSLLRSRLDRAVVAARVMPEEPVIVSGFGEADAMACYLIERGVNAGRIFVEPAATSTNENLERAHALCPDYTYFRVVTNDFHVLRTRMWAWHLGIRVRVHGVRTPAKDRAWNYLREVVATPHSLLRIVWRRVVAWRPASALRS